MNDNAIVNVSLAKRGNIDAQLDAYKRDKAREAKRKRQADAKQWADDLAECRKIIDTLSDDRLTQLGAKHGMTIRQTCARLHSIAWSQPTILLKALSKEAAK